MTIDRRACLAAALERLDQAHDLERNAARAIDARTLDDHMALANALRAEAREFADFAHRPLRGTT